MKWLELPKGVVRTLVEETMTRWNIEACRIMKGNFFPVMDHYISANWRDVEWSEDIHQQFVWGFDVWLRGMEYGCPFPQTGPCAGGTQLDRKCI